VKRGTPENSTCINYFKIGVPSESVKFFSKLMNSVAGIAACHRLDGPSIESCTRPDWPWGPPSLLYGGYRVVRGEKAVGAWR
jgi:hypothetical protein